MNAHPFRYLHCHDIDGAIAGYIINLRETPLKNYPDAAILRALPKSTSEVFRIGYIGSVRSRIPEFTALFEAVRGMRDVHMDIYGYGIDYEKLKRQEEQYTNVIIHGAFDGRTELTGLYEKNDVLFCGYAPKVLNYLGDSETVKFYKAICTGTPMIMPAHIGMGDNVEANSFGLTCNTRDPEVIREAIRILKDNREFWQSCSDNERAQAHLYDWNQIVSVLLKTYDAESSDRKD